MEKNKVFCDKTLRISFFPAGPKVRLVKKNEIIHVFSAKKLSFFHPRGPFKPPKKKSFFFQHFGAISQIGPFLASFTYFYLLGSHSGLEKRNFWCKQHC